MIFYFFFAIFFLEKKNNLFWKSKTKHAFIIIIYLFFFKIIFQLAANNQHWCFCYQRLDSTEGLSIWILSLNRNDVDFDVNVCVGQVCFSYFALFVVLPEACFVWCGWLLVGSINQPTNRYCEMIKNVGFWELEIFWMYR